MSELSQDEREYDELARSLAGDGISSDELTRFYELQKRIVEAKRRRRPLLAIVGWIFWFFQLRINNPLIRRVSRPASYWLWERLVSPVVNDWIGKIRAADAAAVAPRGYISGSCVVCGGPHGRFPIGGGDPMRFRLSCDNCGPRIYLGGIINRDVQ